jgi:hypothetical protein
MQEPRKSERMNKPYNFMSGGSNYEDIRTFEQGKNVPEW